MKVEIITYDEDGVEILRHTAPPEIEAWAIAEARKAKRWCSCGDEFFYGDGDGGECERCRAANAAGRA